jgi:hypothetical protein
MTAYRAYACRLQTPISSRHALLDSALLPQFNSSGVVQFVVASRSVCLSDVLVAKRSNSYTGVASVGGCKHLSLGRFIYSFPLTSSKIGSSGFPRKFDRRVAREKIRASRIQNLGGSASLSVSSVNAAALPTLLRLSQTTSLFDELFNRWHFFNP